MKLFQCQSCGNVLYFENRTCGRCGHRLAYLPEIDALSALEPSGDGWTALAAPGPTRFLCANAAHDACNWLTPPESGEPFCRACRHNGIIPDVSTPENLERWRLMEFAKHQLFYALLRWNLPLATRAEDPEHGLIFNFLSDPPEADGPKVMTGHENGVITIALIEADDAERESRRRGMGEPYRTLVGHFRHEVGHHYWDLLVRDAGLLDACRAVFGDDSQDYEAALKRHYEEGTPPDWQQHSVSAYATTHPLGGLRRDLGALPPHRRHAGDGERLRHGGEAASRRGGRARRAHRLRPLRRREHRPDRRRLAALRLRDEQRLTGDGAGGPLPLRALARRHRQARLHPPPRPRAGERVGGRIGGRAPQTLRRLLHSA